MLLYNANKYRNGEKLNEKIWNNKKEKSTQK